MGSSKQEENQTESVEDLFLARRFGPVFLRWREKLMMLGVSEHDHVDGKMCFKGIMTIRGS